MIMTDDSWYVVRNIRGVTGFVGPGSKPVPLTEAEIERFQVENRQITTNYAVGDSVEVTGGYLEGFVGVVDAIDTEKQLTRVTVSMMGKDVTVEPGPERSEAPGIINKSNNIKPQTRA